MIQKPGSPNPALQQARTAETNLMIQEHLIAGLKNAFPDKGFQYSNPPDPVATLPSPCAAFGTLAISDDGDEAMVYLGGATHGHFGCDDEQLSEAQKRLRLPLMSWPFCRRCSRTGFWSGVWLAASPASGGCCSPANRCPSLHTFGDNSYGRKNWRKSTGEQDRFQGRPLAGHVCIIPSAIAYG